MNEHTSQELSQRLHDKGFGGEHEYVWGRCFGLYDAAQYLTLNDKKAIAGYDYREVIPAYTFTEIWGVLPERIDTYILASKKSKGEMFIGYLNPIMRSWKHWFCTESPAEAVGLLVEWLIDNNHVEVTQ